MQKKNCDGSENEQNVGTLEVNVGDYLGPEYINKQCLEDDEIMLLTEYGLKIEQLYGSFQDIEWGFDEDTNKLYILQSRPITTLKGDTKMTKVKEEKDLKMLVRGLPASPGIASGKVKKY